MQYRAYSRIDLSYVDGGYISADDLTINDDYMLTNCSIIKLHSATLAAVGDIVAVIKDSGAYHKGVITEIDNSAFTISYKDVKELFNDNILNPFLSYFINDSTYVGTIPSIEAELSSMISENFEKPSLIPVYGWYKYGHFYSDEACSQLISCSSGIPYIDKFYNKGYFWLSSASKNLFYGLNSAEQDGIAFSAEKQMLTISSVFSKDLEIAISNIYLNAASEYTFSWKYSGSYKGTIYIRIYNTAGQYVQTELSKKTYSFVSSSFQALTKIVIVSCKTNSLVKSISAGYFQLELGSEATEFNYFYGESFEETKDYPYDKYRLLPISKIDYGTATEGTWSDSSNSINLRDLIISFFEKYNIIVGFSLLFGKTPSIAITIGHPTYGSLLIKDNMLNANFIYEEVSLPDKTSCIVIDESTKAILGKYYLKTDNTITTDCLDPDRALPSKTSIVEYSETTDTSSDSSDTSNSEAQDSSSTDDIYYSVASKELLSSDYYQLVQLSINRDTKMIDFDRLQLGCSIKIINKYGTINTIYTGRKETSGENYIILMFGKSRKNYTDIIQINQRRIKALALKGGS